MSSPLAAARTPRTPRWTALCAFLTLGCAPPPESAPGPDTDSLSYHRDVEPILIEHCSACHVAGGVGPFALSSYEEVVDLAPLIAPAIESGDMPPWSADPTCRSFAHERVMDEAEKSTVLDWIAADMPEGDPADAPEVELPDLDLDEVSLVTRSVEPYEPSAEVTDDYHCLVLDAEFNEPTFLSAYQVVPDPRGVVHHVIFYLVPPSGVPSLLEADAASPAPGYECFGSSGHGGQPMGVWAPGGLPMRFPADAAFVVEPGSKIVAQMHYYSVGAAPGPDETELHLAYLDATPQLRVTMPLLSGFFEIPAGDPAYEVEFELEIDGETPKQIVSVMPHMHLLGRAIELHRVRAGDETCVARVDDWDFDWQQFYTLEDDDFVELQPGDLLRYSCVFDNSAANQPVVDGEQREPEPVAFGEGTFDEMCLNVVTMVEPYVDEPPASTVCEDVDACYAQSCAGDGACYLGCALDEDDACGNCVLQAVGDCGQLVCPDTMAPVFACMAMGCPIDVSDPHAVQACLADTCAAEYAAHWACLEPEIQAGACNDALAPCDLEY